MFRRRRSSTPAPAGASAYPSATAAAVAAASDAAAAAAAAAQSAAAAAAAAAAEVEAARDHPARSAPEPGVRQPLHQPVVKDRLELKRSALLHCSTETCPVTLFRGLHASVFPGGAHHETYVQAQVGAPCPNCGAQPMITDLRRLGKYDGEDVWGLGR